jgi:hypothetical protein
VDHKINRVFEILLHKTFDIDKSVFHHKADITFTANSGALVQKAITVSQIIRLDIQNFLAILQAQSTKKFAQ